MTKKVKYVPIADSLSLSSDTKNVAESRRGNSMSYLKARGHRQR